MDCGPSCLRMISSYYGMDYSLENLREKSHISHEGISMLGISDAAESIGMRTKGVHLSVDQLRHEVPFPCIVHWRNRHFVVVYKVKKIKKFNQTEYFYYIADPANGLLKYSEKEFINGYYATKYNGEIAGHSLLLEPTPEFYKKDGTTINRSKFTFIFSYIKPYKKLIVQLLLGMLTGSILSLLFPFLTQAVVDLGIKNHDLGFVVLILISQLVIFISQTFVSLVRSWILLHLSTRINISLISDFLLKLMKLPISFFNSKMIGDIMQRIQDHKRIESFLTNSSLNIVFSFINLIIFGIVLIIYSVPIFLIFLVGNVIYVSYIFIFLKKRRILDYKRFDKLSANQSNLFQLVSGMQEIKLNNIEKYKRWEWERIQAALFKVSIKGLKLDQFQLTGSNFITQVNNILISFVAAKGVIDGNMTLGMMMSVQYIIGQLNSPINEMIQFIRTIQDAKISLERMGEIHEREDEERPGDNKFKSLPINHSITLKNVTFQYEGPRSPKVLNNINLHIPENKVTAIVGMSGSGKTTLIKLLLGFYEPVMGEILIGNTKLKNMSNKLWRENCGVVMQDGFIFSDTMANNIALDKDLLDKDKLINAAQLANIKDDIESFPLKYNTKIGQEGQAISGGQKQRMLIARAVYKDPEYLFFDEATNSLDAKNEEIIVNNLEKFFRGKTVVVVAHRLSTVKNADQIVVLEKGKIIEKGTHRELVNTKGAYYTLVKNQLELGG